jgi:uncharacterized protein (TIGR02231 family)
MKTSNYFFKQSITKLIIFLSFTNLNAHEQKTKSKLIQANVFIHGAQLFHSANVVIPKGTSEIHLEGISPFIKAQSLQAGGKGDFIISDVSHFIYYPEPNNSLTSNAVPPHLKKEIKLLEDSILNLQFDFEMLNDRKNLLQVEKNIINNNKIYKGEGKSDSLAFFTNAMEFYHKKMSEINAELLKIKKEEHRISAIKTRQELRLDGLINYSLNHTPTNPKASEPIHKIKMTIMAENQTNGIINVNYFIDNAGWTPQYDIRATNTDSPIKLNYKAQIYQSSGLDWYEVKLVLSTSNPQKPNRKPELNPWYLNFYTQNYSYNMPKSQSVGAAQSELIKRENVNDEIDAASLADYTILSETFVNYQYEIKVPFKILAEGKNHSVTILSKEVQTNYEYVAVPKLDSDAFVMARINGWEDLNLISGKANIYFENMYVGETYINSNITSDTLIVALGRDNSIQVNRKQVKTSERERFFNQEKILTYAYEINVKNTKNSNIKLVIEDQIPVSKNQQIKVEMQDNGKSDINENTGILRWNLNIKAKDSKTLKYTFIVKHDKDKQISQLP